MSSHTQVNFDNFYYELTTQYAYLFAYDPEYSYAKSIKTPHELAKKMTIELDCGSANKDGDGIKRTCHALRLPHTYKAIRAYLAEK